MHALLPKKSTLVLLLVLCAVFAFFVWKSYKGALQQNRTRSVATAFGFAMHELQQTPPGIQRVEAFLGRLKAIDTKSASPEVQKALGDYIAAVEPSLQAVRSGRPSEPYDPGMAQAKQRLIDAVRENE